MGNKQSNAAAESQPEQEVADTTQTAEGTDTAASKQATAEAPQSSAASSDGPGTNEAIFFPDEKLPCKFGSECRRGDKCDYSHSVTSLTIFLKFLGSAEKSLDVCVFNITCNEIADTLLASHKRGVKVRIITDDDQSKSKGSDVESMSQQGIEVRLDNSPMHMHHKYAVVDNRLLLNGSFNWTRQAVLGNRENVMVTSDAKQCMAFSEEFEKMWKLYEGNNL